MKINQNGFWETTDSTGHVHDSRLADHIISLFKSENIRSVVDFGCGMGDYAHRLISEGIPCEAYDGNPNTPELTRGLGKVLDLSESFDLGKTFDCVLTLEVGEHIPEECEQTFINNIVRHTDNLLLLSWAILGQVGDGHVNCKNNDYIVSEIEKRGFAYDLVNSNLLRNSISHAQWFKNTIMVFKKNIENGA